MGTNFEAGMRRYRRTMRWCRSGLVAVLVSMSAVPRVNAMASLLPITVAGARSVETRDTAGHITRITTIPTRSVFSSHGGGGQPCSFVASTAGTASDGQRYVAGQTVRSMRWLFIEGEVAALGEPSPVPPATGLLVEAVRHFVVFCDSTADAIGILDVPAADPVLDPRGALVQLRNAAGLSAPVVYSNPVVARGGYVVRYQVWLAARPSVWVVQRSNSAFWRGWALSIVAQPIGLDFVVRPVSPAGVQGTALTVACVAVGSVPAVSTVAVPAMPSMPARSTPGVNGACRYTPSVTGWLTVQARVRYRITFWANGYHEASPDYVLAGPIATYRVGELSSVNQRP